jgi:hypothetical protein
MPSTLSTSIDDRLATHFVIHFLVLFAVRFVVRFVACFVTRFAAHFVDRSFVSHTNANVGQFFFEARHDVMTA